MINLYVIKDISGNIYNGKYTRTTGSTRILYAFSGENDAYIYKDKKEAEKDLNYLNDILHKKMFIVELVAVSPELIETARDVCKSYEAYTALDKSKDQWDEYDSWILPIWKKFINLLNQIST